MQIQLNVPVLCVSCSGYDQEISSGRGVSPDHMKAQSILRDLTPLDSQLNNILSRGIHGDEGMRKVLGLR